MSDEVRLQAIVHGHVQGVNFRYYTQLRARELGVKGYVRNKWDGTVEVVAEGERAAVEQLLEFLKVGPRAAQVQRVDSQWQDPTGQFAYFEVRY